MSAARDKDAALRSFEAAWHARPEDRIAATRADAMRRFLALGLPSPRDESWRHTNLRALASRPFADAEPASSTRTSWLAGVCADPIALVNGRPSPTALGRTGDPALSIETLRASIDRDPASLAARLASIGDAESERWALLNRALFVDGLHVRIAGRVAAPLLIVHCAETSRDDAAVHSRVLVDVAAGAEATIIEHHLGGSGRATLVNHATQLHLAPGASVEHYRVFSGDARTTQFDALEITQAADSRCRQFTVALGGALLRANLSGRLDAPGAEHDSYSLLVGHGARQVDCVNAIVHAASRTTSRQTARALAAGTSRVIFNSRVLVEAGTAGAASNQSSRGLLLSPTAEIDARPQLEILADDVKCAHGATTGRLDPNMLFYLLARGIDRAAAQTLLIYAFLDDLLTGMSIPGARRAIEEALIEELPGADLLRAYR
ncbi:MAG: Fe-S cluster assembly protein SufD [Gammaproteobacteria bacterium]|nr:Fe-S cluster assembly protein SufD [Gammaproteobacteria bacterium]